MGSGIQAFAAAIAQNEGYGVPGAIPTVANNPGDLALGDQGYGTMGQNITVYPSAQAGYTALMSQAAGMVNGSSLTYPAGTTIQQAMDKYSGGNPTAAANVANSLGVSPSSPLTSLGSWFGNTSLGKIMKQYQATGGFSAHAAGSGAGSPSASGTYSLFIDAVLIIIGIIAVGIGLFGLDSSKQIIVNTAKAAAAETVAP